MFNFAPTIIANYLSRNRNQTLVAVQKPTIVPPKKYKNGCCDNGWRDNQNGSTTACPKHFSKDAYEQSIKDYQKTVKKTFVQWLNSNKI